MTDAGVASPASLAAAWVRSLTDDGRSQNTVAAYRGDVQLYVRFLGRQGRSDLRDVGPGDVEGFVRMLTTEPGRAGRVRADSTIARVVSAVRVFHAWCADRNITAGDPATGVARPSAVRTAPRVLERDEVAMLVASVDGVEPASLRDRAVLSLLAGTGISAAEVVALDVQDVLEDGRRLRVRGERPRPLPVPDARALRTWLAMGRGGFGAGSPALFPNARGDRLTRQWIWRLVTDAATGASLPDGTSPRTLRNTFAALERAAGTPEPVVLELLGRAPWTGAVDGI